MVSTLFAVVLGFISLTVVIGVIWAILEIACSNLGGPIE